MRAIVAAVMLFAMLSGSRCAWAQVPAPVAATPAVPTPQAAAMQARMAEALKDYHGPDYVHSEAMIPARDGVLLHTVIFRPKDSDTSGPPLPFLMTRTPYGVDGTSRSGSSSASRSWRRAATSSSSRTSAGGMSRAGSL